MIGEKKLVKIVLIGETGVGKSTVGNTFLGKEVFKTGSSIDAITQETRFEKGKFLGDSNEQDILVGDTQGYNDPNGKDKKNASQMINVLKDVRTLNAFILVFNGGNIRWNEATWSVLNLLNNMFPNFWDNLIVVINFWPADQRSQNRRKQQKRQEGDLTQDIKKNLKLKYGVEKIRISFLDVLYDKDDDEEKSIFYNEIRNIQIIINSFKDYPTCDLKACLKDSDQQKENFKKLNDEMGKLQFEHAAESKRMEAQLAESKRREAAHLAESKRLQERMEEEKKKREEAERKKVNRRERTCCVDTSDEFNVRFDDFCVTKVWTVYGGFIYKYRVYVVVNESCDIVIYDASGDAYSLWCSSTGQHYVDYNSSDPTIIKIVRKD